MRINVVDAPMGTGKTNAAIHFMNTAPGDMKFIYVTPNNSETLRIKNECAEKEFYVTNTDNASGTKTQSLEELISENRNVAITHSLFVDHITDRTLAYIAEKNYTLMLDEVVELVRQEEIKTDEINELDGIGKDGNFNDQYKLIEQDSNGIVRWTGKKKYEGNARKWKKLIDTGNIQRIDKNMFFWVTPIMKFKVFKEIYVLTYEFESSGLKYYYDMWNTEYRNIYINNNDGVYSFTETKVTDDFKERVKPLIYIIDGDCNDIGYEYTALSKSWFENNRDSIKALGNTTYGIFYNRLRLKSKDVIWTVFSDYSGTYQKDDKPWKKKKRKKNSIGIKSYKNGYLASNTKATNEYKDRRVVAYLINKFMNVPLKRYFEKKGIPIKENEYAVSEMIQFIWRSAIRDGKPILLYIPSERMRNLLIKSFGLDERNIINYKDLSENTLNEIEYRAAHYHDNTERATEDDLKVY